MKKHFRTLYHKLLHYENILVFIFLSFFTLNYFWYSCEVFGQLNFDSQNFLTWNYLTTTSHVTYDNTYLVYGILFHFKQIIPLFQILYFFTVPAVFFYVFIILRKLYPERLVVYGFLTVILLFMYSYMDFHTVTRYGLLMAYTGTVAYLFTTCKSISKRFLFFCGVISGILFSLIPDIGVYSISFLFLFLLYELFITSLEEKKKHSFTGISSLLTKRLASLISGLFIGVIPFFMYLFLTEQLDGFIFLYTHVSDTSIFGKTPFFPGLRSFENLFTFTMYFISLFYIAYHLIFTKVRKNILLSVVISVVFCITLLEMKSIIRSIDKQITFLALFLLVILFVPLKTYLLTYLSKRVFSLFFITFLFYLFSLPFVQVAEFIHIVRKSSSPLSFFSQTINSLNHFFTPACYADTMNTLLKSNSSYMKVSRYIKAKKNNTVYSYPADPLFYILLRQSAPYNLSVYDGSPFISQKRRVSYIKENDVDYVIYNTRQISLQDGVPDIIRGNQELQYILQNYTYDTEIDDFVILRKRNDGEDLMHSKGFRKSSLLQNRFLINDLANIPRNEGEHKAKIMLGKYPSLMEQLQPFEKLNEILRENPMFSKNRVMVITGVSAPFTKVVQEITLKTSDGIQTRIRYYDCEKDSLCFINLQNLPAFAISRNITHVRIPKNAKATFVSNPDPILLW